MATLLSKIRAANRAWFNVANKRFFNDVSYYAYRSKRTHKPYLVRSTYGWSDMFGQERQLTFRVNEINPDTLEVRSMSDTVFKTLQEAKQAVYEAL